jgi:putative transposase
MAQLRFFNPYADIRFTANRLPHWQQEGAVYFVTFRLADAVPRRLRDEWENERQGWLRVHPKPWSNDTELEYHKRFSSAMEQWLDAGYGSCVLRRRDCAQLVDDTLQHFDSQRLALIASVVMPNHVHVLFLQNAEWPLEKVLRSWKSFTSRRINALLGRDSSLWQRDYFDRLVRDEKHFANCVR